MLQLSVPWEEFVALGETMLCNAGEDIRHPDYHADGEINNFSPKRKLLKLLKHLSSPGRVDEVCPDVENTHHDSRGRPGSLTLGSTHKPTVVPPSEGVHLRSFAGDSSQQ